MFNTRAPAKRALQAEGVTWRCSTVLNSLVATAKLFVAAYLCWNLALLVVISVTLGKSTLSGFISPSQCGMLLFEVSREVVESRKSGHIWQIVCIAMT